MISLLCPTRGRPANMRRFAGSAWETSRGDVQIIWYVDNDDWTSITEAQFLGTTPVVGPRKVLSQCWNACAARAKGEILGHMCDEVVFRTPGWDDRVCEAFERYADRIAFVHGRDGIHDERLGTHGFLSRRWVDTVGYFVPPYFSSDYNDTWLTTVANMIDRRVFLPGVFTEHMHPSVDKAELDQTHMDRLERHVRDRVDDLYESLAREREADASKLRSVMWSGTPMVEG